MNELLNDYSPTYEALTIIYGTLESETDTFKSFVTTGFMMESGMPNEVVMESASDVFKSIANGFKKFIEKVKAFFKKILLYITSASQDLDKVAKEVEKVIKDKDVNFTINGYDFTVLDKQGPNTREFNSIVSKYNEDMGQIDKLKTKDVKDEIIEWLNESHLDKLRAEVLGVKDPIPEDDYLETIRKFYRSESDETSQITVDNSYVNSIISHAKKLEDTKKSCIKDRDTLLTLLTKTENFFGRTIQIYYKGSDKTINASKVNTDNNKFSKEDNEVTISNDDTTKMITLYATYKSKQVNKIAGMINLVACERVNALKDQISQERTILRKCLFGSTKDENKESVSDSFVTGYNGLDYSIAAMESDIQEYKNYENLSRMVLLSEANTIVSSINSNRVQIMEADADKLAGKVKQAIANIIDTVVKAFMEKAIGNTEKYKEWVVELLESENKLSDKAKAKKEFTMANFFDADYKKMANDLRGAISKAYSVTDYTNVSWATSILPSLNSLEKLRDTDVRKELLNYYRTGKADQKLDMKTMNGNELEGKLKDMTDYVANYSSRVKGPVDGINNAIKSSSQKFKVTESWDSNTFLDVLSCPVCESDLVMCIDYKSVLEAEGTENPLKGDTGKSVNQATKAASTETQSGKETQQSATAVSATDDPNAKKELDAQTPEGKTNNAAVSYKRTIDGFFKQCITLYLKTREEQFIAYVNALSNIDGARPRFDKNGKYISKKQAKEEKDAEDKEATQAESK